MLLDSVRMKDLVLLTNPTPPLTPVSVQSSASLRRTALLQYANIEAGCTSVKGSEIAWNETEGRMQTDEEADAVDMDCQGKVSSKRNEITPLNLN